MAVRELVQIDEERCTGCGDCVTACAEGAIQIVDGTAKLVSDTYCDGLGACLGHCPEDAISILRVEARAFDEEAVERHLASQSAVAVASGGAGRSVPAPLPLLRTPAPAQGPGGCPGSRTLTFERPAEERGAASTEQGASPSQLRQWPVQLHLVSPHAPYFAGADVLLAADCAAFAVGDFHRDHLKGHGLAIACPKLDQGQEVYLEKLVSLIDEAKINTLTVMIMEVPCCGGLVALAQTAAQRASRKIPIKRKVVGVQGEILAEAWV
jgi:Pyruvate/2-oxoacid:ferredoxin oxidoreductase delta subunit